jgi:endoglucanase
LQGGIILTDLTAFLGGLTELRGITGDETPVAQKIADAFSPLCDSVSVDAMSNVIARAGSSGPRVMITAHLDEIGLLATDVEEDGAIRIGQVGGVDPRILPGSRVTVYAEEGPMPGVVGAVPPHLLSKEDQKKNYELSKLHVDMGLPPERVRALVRPGTPVTLFGPLRALQNNRRTGKSIDDRCGVAVMLRTAELLQGRELPAQIFFVAAAQEETSSFGAMTSAHTIRPDIGVVIDVTMAESPGCEGLDNVHPMDKVVMTEGPNVHPRLHRHIIDLAKRNRVDVQSSPTSSVEGTDASVLQLMHAGVPTVLVEIPLRYMHTTVETISMDVLEEVARLLAAFVVSLGPEWEELLCY